MFSFADAMLLRPLPVREPDRVLAINTTVSAQFGQNPPISYPDYIDLRDRNRTFDGLVAAFYAFFGFSPNPNTLPRMKWGLYVSGNFFRVLGVEPALGRSFRPDEDEVEGRDPVVVLVHDFWVGQFGASPSVLMILAAVGLYGLVAYSVSRRTTEIGIRRAIGAGRRALVWMVLRQGLQRGLAGVLVGSVVALFACRAATAALSASGFQHVNPLIYVAIPLLLLIITALASWAPARRAAHVDPLRALRAE
jgi:ABC-type antimicrobial peptide transport system permease subunit